MPLANDASTGGRSTTVDRDIIAAAAVGARSRDGESDRTSAGPITPQTILRGPTHPSNVSGHTNPVPTNMFAPNRQALIDREIVDDLGMKTGALTTFDDVDYTFKMPTQADQYADALAAGRAEAREQGLTGTAIDVWASQAAPRLMKDERATEAGDDATAAFKAGIRATRRGVNQGGSAERARAMTSAEFAALSPRQKAAVELNSMLLEAAKADRGLAQKGDPGGKEYDAAVEALFTGEGRTAPYAPNTVGVLENIGWTGVGTDLEDVLSGKLGFTRQDIEDLGPEREGVAPDASLNTGEHLRDQLQSSLVKAFTASRKEAVQGENLLAAKQELLGYDKLPGFSEKKGREVVPGVDVNTFIRSGFDLLTNSNTEFTPEQIIADARQNLTETEFQQFLNFVDVNSRDAKNYRQPLGANPEQTYFDPVEFRKSIAAVLRKER